MAGEPLSATARAQRVQRSMHDTARELLDTASAAGLTLRLLGGLAVREH